MSSDQEMSSAVSMCAKNDLLIKMNERIKHHEEESRSRGIFWYFRNQYYLWRHRSRSEQSMCDTVSPFLLEKSLEKGIMDLIPDVEDWDEFARDYLKVHHDGIDLCNLFYGRLAMLLKLWMGGFTECTRDSAQCQHTKRSINEACDLARKYHFHKREKKEYENLVNYFFTDSSEWIKFAKNYMKLTQEEIKETQKSGDEIDTRIEIIRLWKKRNPDASSEEVYKLAHKFRSETSKMKVLTGYFAIDSNECVQFAEEYLKLTHQDTEEIQKSGDEKDQIMKMVQLWKKRNPNASTEEVHTLADKFRSDTSKMNVLVDYFFIDSNEWVQFAEEYLKLTQSKIAEIKQSGTEREQKMKMISVWSSSGLESNNAALENLYKLAHEFRRNSMCSGKAVQDILRVAVSLIPEKEWANFKEEATAIDRSVFDSVSNFQNKKDKSDEEVKVDKVFWIIVSLIPKSFNWKKFAKHGLHLNESVYKEPKYDSYITDDLKIEILQKWKDACGKGATAERICQIMKLYLENTQEKSFVKKIFGKADKRIKKCKSKKEVCTAGQKVEHHYNAPVVQIENLESRNVQAGATHCEYQMTPH